MWKTNQAVDADHAQADHVKEEPDNNANEADASKVIVVEEDAADGAEQEPEEEEEVGWG